MPSLGGFKRNRENTRNNHKHKNPDRKSINLQQRQIKPMTAEIIDKGGMDHFVKNTFRISNAENHSSKNTVVIGELGLGPFADNPKYGYPPMGPCYDESMEEFRDIQVVMKTIRRVLWNTDKPNSNDEAVKEVESIEILKELTSNISNPSKQNPKYLKSPYYPLLLQIIEKLNLSPKEQLYPINIIYHNVYDPLNQTRIILMEKHGIDMETFLQIRKKMGKPIREIELKIWSIRLMYWMTVFKILGWVHRDLKPRNLQMNVLTDGEAPKEGFYTIPELMDNPSKCTIIPIDWGEMNGSHSNLMMTSRGCRTNTQKQQHTPFFAPPEFLLGDNGRVATNSDFWCWVLSKLYMVVKHASELNDLTSKRLDTDVRGNLKILIAKRKELKAQIDGEFDEKEINDLNQTILNASKNLPNITNHLKKFEYLGFSKKFWNLCKRGLQFDPKKRIILEEYINHEWFTDIDKMFNGNGNIEIRQDRGLLLSTTTTTNDKSNHNFQFRSFRNANKNSKSSLMKNYDDDISVSNKNKDIGIASHDNLKRMNHRNKNGKSLPSLSSQNNTKNGVGSTSKLLLNASSNTSISKSITRVGRKKGGPSSKLSLNKRTSTIKTENKAQKHGPTHALSNISNRRDIEIRSRHSGKIYDEDIDIDNAAQINGSSANRDTLYRLHTNSKCSDNGDKSSAKKISPNESLTTAQTAKNTHKYAKDPSKGVDEMDEDSDIDIDDIDIKHKKKARSTKAKSKSKQKRKKKSKPMTNSKRRKSGKSKKKKGKKGARKRKRGEIMRDESDDNETDKKRIKRSVSSLSITDNNVRRLLPTDDLWEELPTNPKYIDWKNFVLVHDNGDDEDEDSTYYTAKIDIFDISFDGNIWSFTSDTSLTAWTLSLERKLKAKFNGCLKCKREMRPLTVIGDVNICSGDNCNQLLINSNKKVMYIKCLYSTCNARYCQECIIKNKMIK